MKTEAELLKTFIIIVLGFFLATGLIAQENRKEWSEGKLNWLDFSERISPNAVSELKYYLGYKTDKQNYGDTIVLRNVAEGYIDTKLSWINPNYKTLQYLRYNQVVFDIVEVYRRKLQYELDRVNSAFEISGKFNFIYSECNAEIHQFHEESGGGQDMAAIVFWEQKISDELNIHPDLQIPEFEDRNFGYALHAGFGAGAFTGSLGEHFSPSFNFIFGFDFAWKNLIFYLDGTLAGANVKKDFSGDETWYEGQRAHVAVIDFSLGYALVNNAKIKLSPFAGLGITEFSGENKDDKENGLNLVDYNVLFGLNADYKVRTKIKFLPTPFSNQKEKTETSIRARLYISRASYYDDLQGFTVNLTLGICGFGNMFRLK